MIPCTKRCYIFIVGHLREVINTVHKRSLGYGVMELNKDYYTLLACWWVDAHSLENKRTALRRNGRERFVLTQMGVIPSWRSSRWSSLCAWRARSRHP